MRVFIGTFEPILEKFFSYSHTSVCHCRETCPEQKKPALSVAEEGSKEQEPTLTPLFWTPAPRFRGDKFNPAKYVFSLSCFIGGTAILAVFSRAGSPCHIMKLLIQLSG